MLTSNSVYSQRLASVEDVPKLSLLWQSLVQQRIHTDPFIQLNPNFNFEQYLLYRIKQSQSFFFLLEVRTNEYSTTKDIKNSKGTSCSKEIVGCLAIYFYNETVSSGLECINSFGERPFKYQPFGEFLGFYVDSKNRKSYNFNLLIEKVISKAKELKVTTINWLIDTVPININLILERYGFESSLIQYCRRYLILEMEKFPYLEAEYSDKISDSEMEDISRTIPLRNTKNYDLVKNPNGEIVFIQPVTDEAGNVLRCSGGLPIYPNPLRDIDHAYVFDQSGKLVTCPVLQDCDGVVEYSGIPQFRPPLCERVDQHLQLKQDENGTYLFAKGDMDEMGCVRRSPDGKPLFK